MSCRIKQYLSNDNQIPADKQHLKKFLSATSRYFYVLTADPVEPWHLMRRGHSLRWSSANG